MLAGGFKLVADQAQSQQKHPEVVFGAGGVEVALAAGGGAGVEGLGPEGEAKLDVGLDLAGVQGGLEPSELQGASKPHIM